jgi:hypothetical protein
MYDNLKFKINFHFSRTFDTLSEIFLRKLL